MSKRRRRKRHSGQPGPSVGEAFTASLKSSNSSSPSQEADPTPETFQAKLPPSTVEAVAERMSESTYLQERTSLVEIEQKSADQHDKAILTIAMGGLALSIAFLKDIAPHPLPDTLKYVGISWTCFVLGILTILLSFLTSQLACRKQRDLLDELYLEGNPAVIEKANRWSSTTHRLNKASYCFVFLAVVFLTWFSWLNLK